VTGDHGKLILEQAREIDAPPEQVFRMLTQPEELVKWWGPRGFTTQGLEIDLRVGGRLRFTMQPPDGEAFHLSGEFVEIQPPFRLRFTFRWDEPVPDDRETVVELSLNARERRTTLLLTQGEFATEERLELHRSGWADSFEKLDVVLNAFRT
jgi:uncharacterized protein YndB with AHSA1/START domain